MTTTTTTLRDVLVFVRQLDTLRDDERRAFELAFFNPTDAAIVCFEQFNDSDKIETLRDLLNTAFDLGIQQAARLDAMLVLWMHSDDTVRP